MRLFTDVLRDHRNGKLVERLTEELSELVEAIQDCDKAGTLTLKLKIEPNKGEDGAVSITPSVSINKPYPDLPKALFFADGQGGLHRESLTQTGMFGEADLGDKPRRAG